MSVLMLWIIALAVAYLLGSLPTGYILVRIFKQQDIRSTGSGNIGATNVARSGAKGLGIATLLLDILKGFLAVYIAQKIAAGAGFPVAYDIAATAGLVVILAHIFPVWLGFRGGKGVATAFGVFIALTPGVAPFVLLAFAITFALTRYVSLASIAGAVTFLVLALLWDTKHRLMVDLVYIAIPLLVVAKHHANIRRLIARTEPKFGSPGSDAAAETEA